MDNISDYLSDNVALRMLLQLDPTGVGSAIDVYLADIYERNKRQRIKSFFTKISARKIKITNEIINSDDFLFAFVSTTNAVISTNNENKIELFANLFVNGVNSGTYNSNIFEQFLEILQDVSFLEIQLVDKLFILEGKAPVKMIVENKEVDANPLFRANSIWDKFEEIAKKDLGIDASILQNLLTRLNRTGLFVNITGVIWGNKGDRGHTTPLYNEFRNWIIKQPEDSQ